MWYRLKRFLPALALCSVLLVFCSLAAAVTGGARAFTSEGWRRLRVDADPPLLPTMPVVDFSGKPGTIEALCGRPMVIEFIYTRCTTVCLAAGALSSQLARRLSVSAPDALVLSISIDPEHDTPEALSAYKRRNEGEPTAWQLVSAASEMELQRLLMELGVTVIPDGKGGYEHNAALHLVDRSCRVRKIVDLGDLDGAEAFVTHP